MLPEADHDATLRRAQEVCHAIGELRLEHAGRTLGTVSASGGIALFPLHAEDAGTLLRRADEALYVAKRAGRNRVVQAEIVEPAPT